MVWSSSTASCNPTSIRHPHRYVRAHPVQSRRGCCRAPDRAAARTVVPLSLAASTGVESAHDVAAYLLAGADVVMSTSSLLRHGPEHAVALLDGLQAWMARKGFVSLEQVRGRLSPGEVPTRPPTGDPVTWRPSTRRRTPTLRLRTPSARTLRSGVGRSRPRAIARRSVDSTGSGPAAPAVADDTFFSHHPVGAVGALAALGGAAFCFVTGESLPWAAAQLSAGLRVSLSAVGLLVTIYAVVVVAVSAPLTHLSGRFPARQ